MTASLMGDLLQQLIPQYVRLPQQDASDLEAEAPVLCQLQMHHATQDSPSQPDMPCKLSTSQVDMACRVAVTAASSIQPAAHHLWTVNIPHSSWPALPCLACCTSPGGAHPASPTGSVGFGGTHREVACACHVHTQTAFVCTVPSHCSCGSPLVHMCCMQAHAFLLSMKLLLGPMPSASLLPTAHAVSK